MDASETDDGEGELVQEFAYMVAETDTTCSICDAEFLDAEDLKVHVKQVHEGSSTPKLCQFCDATYTDLEDYACHIRDIHLANMTSCRCCSKCFIDLRKAKKHERKHWSKSNMYACSQCPGHFTTQKELELHELVNHDNTIDGEFLKCTPHLSFLLKLKVIALLQYEEPILVCSSCDFTATDIATYLDHLKADKCHVVVCDKCGDIFKTKASLKKHFLRKNKCLDPTEYTNDLTICPTCKNEVHGKQMLAHLKICRIFKCYPCDIVFTTIDELSAHQSLVHPVGLDVSKCRFCSKEYVGEDSLEKHIDRAHRDSFIMYKYACKECGEIFKHPQKLFAHYFTKHKDLQPYTCKICNLKFRVRKRFTIHIKIEHKSIGVVEFDEQYHVFFNGEKSENPFVPTCVIPELLYKENKKSIKPKKNKESFKSGLHLDMLNTETEFDEFSEAVETVEQHKTVPPKKKVMKRKRNREVVVLSSSEEDDAEPLHLIKKRAERQRFQKLFRPRNKKMKQQIMNRKQFTCKDCQKYCYTYQNYHNHIKTHNKNELIECVKCSRSFKTKKRLTEHISTDHATSRLIETLKNVRERKLVETHNSSVSYNHPMEEEEVEENTQLSMSEKFMRTIKRVKIEKSTVSAKIKPAPDNNSVKNFLENFVPDVTDSREPKLEHMLTIKQHDSPFYRKSSIHLTKCKTEPPPGPFGLKMPERFKEDKNAEHIKLNVKIVHQPTVPSRIENYPEIQTLNNMKSMLVFEDHDDLVNESIPDVAHEVMLEGTEEPPKPSIQAPQKIVIKKLPQGYPNIHIATMQPEAPFFKIIKVEGNTTKTIVLDTGTIEPKKKPENPKDEIISLPDGSKFVTVNPFAHLLGDTSVEKVLEPTKNKHYKPAIKNFKGLLAEALQNLDKPKPKKPKKTAEKKKWHKETVEEIFDASEIVL